MAFLAAEARLGRTARLLSQREEKLLVAARIGRFVGEGLIGDSEWWILWRGGWGRGFGREAFGLVRPVRVRGLVLGGPVCRQACTLPFLFWCLLYSCRRANWP